MEDTLQNKSVNANVVCRLPAIFVQLFDDNCLRVFFIYRQVGYFNLAERVLHFEIAHF